MADGINARFSVVKLFIAVQPFRSSHFHVKQACLFIALRQISACRADENLAATATVIGRQAISQ